MVIEMKPKWKHVWITGASSGLGEYTARILAQKGCKVSITARRAKELDIIAAGHKNISSYPADVTDVNALRSVVTQMEEDHGEIDLAIFSAGAWFQSTLKDLNTENFAKTLNVNIMGVVNALDCVLPQMLNRGCGHVSWIASVAGYGGLPTSASYGASKAAQINMAESMHSELDRAGVAISVINPGFVRTPMTDKNKFPMPFLMEPEDAAVKIVAGLEKRKFEIAFPWQFVWMLKIINLLPYWLYLPIIKKIA